MTLENAQENTFIVPSIIAEGTAFELISLLRRRKELYECITRHLNIRNKENTYLKYFLYATDPKKGGIPKNQNFKVVCEAMENGLTVVLLNIFRETETERLESLAKWWGIRNNQKSIMDTINGILTPYSENLKQLKENEKIHNVLVG